MKSDPKSVSSAKLRSTKIAEFLKQKGFDVKHGHALELLSISQGFDSWNHYSAALQSTKERSPHNCHVINETSSLHWASLLLYCRAQIEQNPKSYALVFCEDLNFDSLLDQWSIPDSKEWQNQVKKVKVRMDVSNDEIENIINGAAGKIVVLVRNTEGQDWMNAEGRALYYFRWLDSVVEKLNRLDLKNQCLGRFFNFNEVSKGNTLAWDSDFVVKHFKNRKEDWFFLWKSFSDFACAAHLNLGHSSGEFEKRSMSVHAVNIETEQFLKLNKIADVHYLDVEILGRYHQIEKAHRFEYSLNEWHYLLSLVNPSEIENWSGLLGSWSVDMSRMLKILKEKAGDEVAVGWLHEMSKHLSRTQEKNSMEQKKKNEGQNRLMILERIVKKEYPHAKLIPSEEIEKQKGSSEIEAIDVSHQRKSGIVKSVTAEQMIKKWSNPEYIRKMYGDKEKSDIASVVIEHHGRRETLVIDLEVERVIGISG